MTSGVILVLVAVLCGISCALAGIFLVLRKMAMTADAISHAILPGLLAGYVLANGPSLWAGMLGAVAAGLLTVWLIELLVRSNRVREDSAIGLVFPAMFALGVALISKFYSNVHIDTDAVLYGEIAFAPFDTLQLGGKDYGPQSIWILGVLTLVNGAFVALFFKELKAATFDPDFAMSAGIKTRMLRFGLLTVVTVTTVGAFSAVGAILTVGFIVTPMAAALLLSYRLPAVIGIAIAISVICSFAGVQSAMAMDVSISGLIAVFLGIAFLLAMLFSPMSGILAMAFRRKKLQQKFAVDTLIVHLFAHEGTENEAEESEAEHLSSELGWRPDRASAIMKRAESEGLIHVESGRLILTPSGRSIALEVSQI